MTSQENKIHLKCALHCGPSLKKKNKGLLDGCLVLHCHGALFQSSSVLTSALFTHMENRNQKRRDHRQML